MKPFVSLFVSLVIIGISSLAQAQAGALPQSSVTTAVDLVNRGKLDCAASVLEKEIQLPGRTAAQRGRAYALLAYAYREEGEFNLAGDAFSRALRLMDEAGDRSNDYAATLDFYAGMLMTTGDLNTAGKALREAARVYERLGNHAALSQVHAHTAELQIERRKYKQADAQIADARAQALLANASPATISEIDATSGWLAIATRKYHQGVLAYSSSLDECRRALGENNAITGWSYLLLGKAEGMDQDMPGAKRSMEKGLSILKETVGTRNFRYVAGELAYSEFLEHAGSHEEAARIISDVNTQIRNQGAQPCATCTVSVWSLRHQGEF